MKTLILEMKVLILLLVLFSGISKANPLEGKGAADAFLYDKVIGNVSLRFALEEMAKKGDLKEAAQRLLRVRK